MKTQTYFAAVISAVLSSVNAAPSPAVTAVTNAKTPPISVSGNAFFDPSGTRFYIRGVDYQPGGASQASDPLADPDVCKRDIKYFAQLGINTIRVYTIDNSANHDVCMEALANEGIYLALDVNTPTFSLNRASETAIQISYNAPYLQSVFSAVDAFAKYDNTLLFYSANEVINSDNTTFAAPYVKAVTRDIRAYIKARGYRQIPVGYSAADIAENRFQMAQYMDCGDESVRSDFFAFNDYSWCNPSTFEQSGWSKNVETFTGYPIPLFLSEYGCNTHTRTWDEVAALYSTEMTTVYSGGLVYEYTMETNNYGLVEIDGSQVTLLDDFTRLEAAFAGTANPSGNGSYLANGTPSSCPPMESPVWLVGTTLLPSLPKGAEGYFTNGAGTPPGLRPTYGSQSSGTTFDFSALNGGSGGVSNGAFNTTGGSSGSSGGTSAGSNIRIPVESIAVALGAGFITILLL